jgi:hypothetical protein
MNRVHILAARSIGEPEAPILVATELTDLAAPLDDPAGI